MAQAIDVKGSKSFCDDVYGELISMKENMIRLRDRSGKEGSDRAIVGMFERHLAELVDAIDWKIQILAHSCPYDWEGSSDFENLVQVDEGDRAPDSDRFSAGYLGG
jgi:hypothetical protein